MTRATSTPASRERRLLTMLGELDDGAGTLADALRTLGSTSAVRRERGFNVDDVMIYAGLRSKATKRAAKSTPDVRDKVAMVRRHLRKLGEDVAAADVLELAELGELQAALNDALQVGVDGLRDRFQTPWSAIGDALGYTRAGAHMRFGKSASTIQGKAKAS